MLENDKLIVTLGSEKDKAIFLQKIVSTDFDIDEIKVYEPTLGDIFVQHTQDTVDMEGKGK